MWIWSPFSAQKHDKKNSLSGNSNFRGFFILESISIRGLPRARPKISANLVARNYIQDIFLIRMNRADRICQKTLKLTDRKLRTQPYVRRETFLLFHPLVKSENATENNVEVEELFKDDKS